ncbi:chemotaxis protein CheW, partial [Stenotrophomonas maltophilia]
LGAAAADYDAQTRCVVLDVEGDTMGRRVWAVDVVANLTVSLIYPRYTAVICLFSIDLFGGVAGVCLRLFLLVDATGFFFL